MKDGVAYEVSYYAAYLTDCPLHTFRDFACSVHASDFLLDHTPYQIEFHQPRRRHLALRDVFSPALRMVYLTFVNTALTSEKPKCPSHRTSRLGPVFVALPASVPYACLRTWWGFSC